MNSNQLTISNSSIENLVNLFLPKEIPDDAHIELVVKFQSDDLKIREFSNYLSLLDRFYGRLYYDGMYAYGHRPDEQLNINEIKKGSIEVVIVESVREVISNPSIIITFLLLKYLPNIIKSSSEVIKNFVESYKYYQEASDIREKRMFRKNLREAMRDDKELQKLSKNQLNQIIEILESLYSKEHKKLPRAINTAKTKIESIILRVKNGE